MKDFNTIWKTLAAEKKLYNIHFIQRAILKAMNSKSNFPKEDIIVALLQKHFTPITNKNKLANGSEAFSAIKNAMYYLKWTKHILGVKEEDFFDTEEEAKEYKRLLSSINMSKIGRKYVYYFTSQEGLTAEQQGVQAGHVLFSLGHSLAKKNVKVNPNETYFQWIGIKTDKELVAIKRDLMKEGKAVHSFYEPDLQNKLTSIALEPILWNKRGKLVEYPLLSHSH